MSFKTVPSEMWKVQSSLIDIPVPPLPFKFPKVEPKIQGSEHPENTRGKNQACHYVEKVFHMLWVSYE